MSVNFDAKLSLDISQFLSGVKKAEGALKGLEAQISKINSKALSTKVQPSSAMPAGSTISQRKAEAAAEEAIMDRMSRKQQLNAKANYQAMQLENKAYEARFKEQNSRSVMVDDSIRMAEREQKRNSNLLKEQMQDREKMNKLHGRALVMNEQFNTAQAKEQERMNRLHGQALRMNTQFDNAQANRTAASLKGLARERYALYDVAAAYAALSAASIGTLTAIIGTAAEYERSFANVIRTTDFVSIKVGEAAKVMRYELMQLANEIPVTFGQITEIATIGNQLGIAQKDLTNFTDTVAKFASTTDVTIENAAMSFGRIGELLDVSDFNALGSAIAFAGVNAVATETQILAVTKEIATTAKQAKFTTPEVIGLSTALASLGIAPEAARGSIIRSFAAINAAITEGGDKLQGYATLAGMTADEFANTWQTNGAQAFNALLSGLQAASDSGANLDSVLRDLGVKNVRDIQTLQKLGDNYDVYAQSIRDANKAFEEGTFLAESYAVIQETVAAKLGVVQNQVNNLLAGLGESTTGPVKGILDIISALLTRLQQFASNPAGQVIAGLVTGVAALTAAVAALNSVVALSRAAMLAYATAMGTVRTNADGVVIGLNKAATAAAILSVTLRSIGIGLLIGAATAAITALGDALQKVTDNAGYTVRKTQEMLGGFVGLQDAITQDTTALKQNATAAGMSLQEYASLHGAIVLNTEAIAANSGENSQAATIQENLGLIIGEQPGLIDNATEAIDSQTLIIGENTQAWIKNAIASSDAFKEIANSAETMKALESGGFDFNQALSASAAGNADQYFNAIIEKYKKTVDKLKAINPLDWGPILNAQDAVTKLERIRDTFKGTINQSLLLGLGTGLQESLDGAAGSTEELNDELEGVGDTLRTVLDHANDLNGVLDRVADLKLGRQLVKDEIAEGWENIAEKATEAEDAIKSANIEIQELTADKAVLEYQLAVAQRYGDEKRAAVIRAKLAKIDEKMGKAQGDLAEAQDDANKSLVGNTKAARDNRQELSGMVDKYQDYIVALVQSGLKGKALEDAVDALNRQFRQQALDAGYAEDELKPYLDTFNNFKEVVDKMPRDVDVEVNSNISAAQQALNEYAAKLSNLDGKKVNTTVTQTEKVVVTTPSYALKLPVEDAVRIRKAYDKGLVSYRELMKALYGAVVDQFGNFVFRANGGPVFGAGTSTSDSIPAMLSNGEYVVRAKAVSAYGLDFMNAINQMKAPGAMPGMGMGGSIGAGVTIAQLSPEDRALLRAAVDRPINLYADSKKIAQTANDGNNMIARRGVR